MTRNQQQSHLPGYTPGLRILLLTTTVILDLKEQRGRNFKTGSPSIQVKQDYWKNRQVCNLEQKLLLTDAPGATEPAQNRTTRHRHVPAPGREPSNPQKEAKDLCIISCQHSLRPRPARPPEKPLAVSRRSKCILYSRRDKKLS